MTKDEVKKALRGRLRCAHVSGVGGLVPRCGNEVNTGRSDAEYMVSSKDGICRLLNDVANGSSCSLCRFSCGGWYGKLRGCRDDGEVRKVLAQACAGWTPPATNRILGA